MQRLSGLDASFLYLETSSQLLHVCGLIVLATAFAVVLGWQYYRILATARSELARS